MGEFSTLITSIITAISVAIPTIYATKRNSDKTLALIEYRLDQIEEKQDKHNGVIERVYKVESAIDVINTKLKSGERGK